MSPFDIESTQNERFGIESTQIKIARQKGGNIIVRRARNRVLQLQVITGFGSTVNISRSSTIVNNCSTISRNVVRRIHLTLANSYHQTQIHGCRFLPRDLLALNRVSSIFPKLDTFVAPGVYRARNTEYRANCRSVAEEDYTLARRRVARTAPKRVIVADIYTFVTLLARLRDFAEDLSVYQRDSRPMIK